MMKQKKHISLKQWQELLPGTFLHSEIMGTMVVAETGRENTILAWNDHGHIKFITYSTDRPESETLKDKVLIQPDPRLQALAEAVRPEGPGQGEE